MIESVQVRQQGAFNFEDHYDNLCALQDSAPIAAVKAHLERGAFDLNGDRIRLNDWPPILNAIRINKTLQFIAVRSYYQMPQEEDEKRAAILRRKLPSIRSKEISHRLVKAIKECLFVSPCLSCVELQGLPLRDRDLHMLVKGILKSSTLHHLSLEFCRIGDQGLEILCKALKNSKQINSVNLSGCSLSHCGAESLAAVIKHQGMQRHNEAWRDSLRYRRPDLDRMSGLRRITANGNPMMGDEGARAFAEALKDDLWLKALDLQCCGIGTPGTRSFYEVLKYNTTIVVLDLRKNPLIDRALLHEMMEQLLLNSNGDSGEYKWMSDSKTEPQIPEKQQAAITKTRRRATKVLNSSLGKKTTIKRQNGNNSCSYCSRVTPVAHRRRARTGVMGSRRLEVARSPGLPWRTAARAHRFRGHPPETGRRYQADPASDLSTSLYTNKGPGAHLDDEEDDSISELLPVQHLGVMAPSAPTSDATAACGKGSLAPTKFDVDNGQSPDTLMRKLEETHRTMNLSDSKEVMIELEQMRRQVREERLARAKADQRVVHLMIENGRLTEEVEKLKKCQNSVRLAEDESFLESVEASFKQFHSFIDMLREAGMGQLVAMAGLETSSMPFASRSNISNGSGLHGSKNNNNNNSNNGVGVDVTGIHDTTYANIPLASSGFVSRQQQLQASRGGKAVDPGASVSMASFSEGDAVLIGSHTGRRVDPSTRANVYSDESAPADVARQEADELYSRLVQETRGTLGWQDSGDGALEAAPKVKASSPSRIPVSSVNMAKALKDSAGSVRSPAEGRADHRELDVGAHEMDEHLHKDTGKIPHSPDKSRASVSVDEEEPSTPGMSGRRGQDDTEEAGLHEMVAEDLDSQDDDF